MRFNLEDRVKIIDNSIFDDYARHNREIGIIDSFYSENMLLPIKIRWNNGDTSFVSENNIILYQKILPKTFGIVSFCNQYYK